MEEKFSNEASKKIFSNNLNKFMKLRNVDQSDIIADLNINKSAISSWCVGTRLPRMSKIQMLANYLNINVSDLIEENSLNSKVSKLQKYMEENNIDSLKLLPVYGTIKAGEPNWAEQNIEGYIPFDSSIDGYSDNEEYFYLKVDGESMNQVIKNGDFALIQKTSSAESGDIIVALVNGYDATLKKFRRINNQFVSLDPLSNDPSIEAITVDLKTTNFQILGKFVGYFGKYKRN